MASRFHASKRRSSPLELLLLNTWPETYIQRRQSARGLSTIDNPAPQQLLVAAEVTANALVGTELNSAQAREKADRIIAEGLIVTLGETRDGPVLSTPEMIAIERELVGLTTDLASQQTPAPSVKLVRELSSKEGLNAEQIMVALASTSGTRLVAVQGGAGSGKSTTLRVVARAWESAGWRVIGSSVAWRAAHAMRDDLGIESRALDSWLARAESGQPVFDNRTVVLVDEAALQSSPQAWRLLRQIDSAGAIAVLVGDEKQLRPIGPGHAMRIIREAIGAVTIETNVR